MQVDVLRGPAPAAHCVLAGSVLLDSGFATTTGIVLLDAFLAGRDVELLAITHAHSDHAGGAHWLRETRGVPVALHPADRATVAQDRAILDQPLLDFTVDRDLADGDVLPGGIEVVATPSQTPGHVAFFLPELGTLVTGDLLQAADVAWLPFDAHAVDDAIASIARLADLGATRAIPGHGDEVTDVPAAAARTIAVYESWREDPSRQASHGSRRIAAGWVSAQPEAPTRPQALAGLEVIPILGAAAAVLDRTPGALAEHALDQLLGSGALRERDGVLVPGFEHEAPAPLWRP